MPKEDFVLPAALPSALWSRALLLAWAYKTEHITWVLSVACLLVLWLLIKTLGALFYMLIALFHVPKCFVYANLLANV
jgi:hypothetical protein